MAASLKESVIISSADGDTVSSVVRICGIKVVAGAGGITVNLKSDAVTGGTVLYTATLAANAQQFELVELHAQAGIYINISAGSGTVYLYRKA